MDLWTIVVIVAEGHSKQTVAHVDGARWYSSSQGMYFMLMGPGGIQAVKGCISCKDLLLPSVTCHVCVANLTRMYINGVWLNVYVAGCRHGDIESMEGLFSSLLRTWRQGGLDADMA